MTPGRPRRLRARHGRLAAALLALAAPLLLAAHAGAAASPQLEARLATAAPSDLIPVVATLTEQVDGSLYEGRDGALLRALRATAARTQAEVAADLEAPVRRYWLVNALAVRASPAEVRELAADPRVAAVDLDVVVRIADADAGGAPFPDPGGGGWGIAEIGAPQVWQAYGVRGGGVTVGSIDTGVDPSNPDLAGKVVGWRDFVAGAARPYDDNGHGTHTVGTMVGGSARGAAIGVAPEARVIVAKAMGANGVGSGSQLLAAAQWLTDPDGDPATADQPAVINNSWSAGDPNDVWFRQMVRRWQELGIVPVFAAGNSGPEPGSVGSPAGYPEVIAVGALDATGAAAPFSARGPVVWQDLDGLGPSAGTVLRKPDLAAPGVNITSSVGDGYLSYSGTSMAAPHVAGTVALLRQAAPGLDPATVADILRRTATDVGTAGPDDATGAGRVDALAAVRAAVGPTPETAFTATPERETRDAELVYGIALGGATLVRTRVDGGAWSAPGPDTALRLTLPEGRHVVEAQAVGDAGPSDPTPARHVVTVDRTAPELAIGWRRRGARVEFTGTVRDRLSGADAASLRWSLGDGARAAGPRVRHTFVEPGARRIALTATDAAGNPARTSIRLRPPVATALRGLRVAPRVSRARGLEVRGRLLRAAAVRVAVRPLRRTSDARPRAAAATGRTVSRAAIGRARPGGFRLVVPIAHLRPGTYRIEVRAVEGRAPGSRLTVRRVVEVRPR